MRIIVVFLTILPGFLFGQEETERENTGQDGLLSLGVRSTYSLFNGHHDESNGIGVGGQFRLQFADQVNSDWFFDYISSDIGDFATRSDYHIGWSVLYYLTKPGTGPGKHPGLRSFKTMPMTVRPYLLAGHCFDYTRMVANNDRSNFSERWSSAVQGGAGIHFNLSPRTDVSFTAQYMLHLGNEVGAHLHEGVVDFHEESSTSMEGHLLINLSLNYKIADLWGKKSL